MPILLKTFSPKVRKSLAALLLAVSSAGLSVAQEAPKKEVSDKVSEALAGIKTAADAKNWDGAIATIDGLLKNAASESYDRALLLQIKAQILLQKGDYGKAVEPLEQAVQLSDKYQFFDARATLDLVQYLAQLYLQEAAGAKGAEVQRPLYDKAQVYFERWLRDTKKPNPDMQLYLANILYNKAQLNPEKLDPELLKRAEEEVKKGLLMSIKPKDTFYVLLLASYQQQGKTAESAEILELLVKQFPNNKQYWAQLAGTYLNLQQDVRTIITIERAQQVGLMNTPKDNFNLVGMYFNIQQFDKAIDLLEKGLKDGSIDPEKKNYELLAASYQQLRKEFKAIDVLLEASKKFPEDGSLNQTAGQLYYSLDKLEDAYKQLKIAVGKKLDKPGQANINLAYFCYELKKFDEALVAANRALELPDTKKEDAQRLKKAIEDSIKEREAFKNQSQ